ncbi:MAG: hypothetical protein COB02_06210 [Candidatus Cloacimonadota bacterium]|nr:MAG: hypothetical protein COB02_06210 [Candidatus Cloacimonadota bacterium]
MKHIILILLFITQIDSNDFFTYNCKYISSKSLIIKLSTFQLKDKYTSINFSSIIFFGNKVDFNKFKQLANKFDIKSVMIRGKILINNLIFEQKKIIFSKNKSYKKNSQLIDFTGLSGSNIKIQLGQRLINKIANFYQISEKGIYLNVLPIKIGNHFEVEVSIKSSGLNESTFYSSQKITIEESTWFSLNSYNEESKSKKIDLQKNIYQIYQKKYLNINLDAKIYLQTMK